MKTYLLDTSKLLYGKINYEISLLQDKERLFLSLGLEKEVSCIEVLPISKRKQLVTFFCYGFNITISGLEEEIIPLEELQEKERKIVVPKQTQVEVAKNRLREIYGADIWRKEYERKMVYMETEHNDFEKNNRIFRLTQEGNDVKATIHMNNHLPGDQKYILKFFFTNTNMDEVVAFFESALGLQAITREIMSTREEYKCEFGEVSIDHMHDATDYYVIEMEMDSFHKNSEKTTAIAQHIATTLELQDCKVVDFGTEQIHEIETSENYFETYRKQKINRIV